MVYAHAATAIRSHSIRKSLKNLPWNLYCNFATPNHETMTKVTPKWFPRGSQNLPKIDQNPDLDPKVSCGVSPGSPGLEKVTHFSRQPVSRGPAAAGEALKFAAPPQGATA